LERRRITWRSPIGAARWATHRDWERPGPMIRGTGEGPAAGRGNTRPVEEGNEARPVDDGI